MDNKKDISPKTIDHLRAVLDGPAQHRHLKLELAAVVDVGRHVVAATYDLEVDSALVLCCFDRIQALANACWIDLLHMPNVHAVALYLADNDPKVDVQWAEEFGRNSICNAVKWFHRKFNVELYDIVRAFKAARPMCPETVNTLHSTKADLNQLRPFPFLDTDDVIGGLADELPLYLAMATDVTFQGRTIYDVVEKKVE